MTFVCPQIGEVAERKEQGSS